MAIIKKIYRDKVLIRRRMMIALTLILTLFSCLVGRLAFLMIVKSPELSAEAKEQWTNEVPIKARRGKILDRNNKELAISANVFRVEVDLNALRADIKNNKYTSDEVADKLSNILGKDVKVVKALLNKKLSNGADMQTVTIARTIEKEQADAVRGLEIRAIMVNPDTKRYYPNNNMLSQTIGITDIDGEGLTGLEAVYNEELSGIPGYRIAETDNKSDELPYRISEYTKPIEGKNLVLTIDEQIQLIIENAAEQALSDNSAKAVSIIAMNPKNGEILGITNKPDFNLNNPREVTEGRTDLSDEELNEVLQEMWRNRAINDAFEPGSIFKIVTAIAALEEGVADEETHYFCGGSKNVAGTNIRCWKTSGHGDQTLVEAMENSCNVAMMDIAEKLGADKLNKYIEKLGFGKLTGVDIPGEAKGIIKKTEDISIVDLATISFGQSNAISPMQYISAFNTIANKGVYITPHIMKEINHTDENGQTIVDYNYESYNKNYVKKQVVSEENTKRLMDILEKVISEGGGKKAYIPGYKIAGKTGTAQKIENGTYGEGKYISSFCGTAPADDPEITIFISIDEPDPSNYYAGQIATPVAKQIFTNIFNHYSISESEDDTSLGIDNSFINNVILPNVRGMSVGEGTEILKNMKLRYQVVGNGQYISDISPKPGIMVPEGSEVIINTGGQASENEIVVPSFIGYTKPEAEKVLESIGLKGTFEGEIKGVISTQSVNAGEPVLKGTEIKFVMDNVLGD